MLSEMSQRKKITVWYYLYVESIKHNSECNEKKKKKQAHRWKEYASGYQWGYGRVGGLEPVG